MKLSQLDGHASFALLGPGFGDGRWLWCDRLEPVERGGRLLFLPYEARGDEPRRFDGRFVSLEAVELDVPPARLTPTFDEAWFTQGVQRVRALVEAGDVYQVNLTTRVDLGAVSAPALMATLLRRGPARFAAWVRAPGFELVSASPELFFRLDGRRVTVEPMKGTAPAGQGASLSNSPKDDAELAMITDLMRNDLTALCEPRSVRVVCERRLLSLPYAEQTVSEVEGTLPAGCDAVDVLRALHPGGSVTGAPKRAAMDCIAAMEPDAREAYCGALALVDGETCTASLLIRSAFRRGGRFLFGVGSGVTWASDPAAEAAELRTKLGALS